ncbi:aspartic proteinase CDR1-like [Ricinus communis]|nr:aspartic proteinase CDR1-like [Ricinus communis]
MPLCQNFPSAAPLLYLAILSLLSFATSKPNGFRLQLIHRDSPESPFYPGKLTNSERISRLVEFSKIRAHNFDSGFSSEAFRPPVFQDFTCYLVKVRIGNPGIPLYLVPDTGSALIWTV